MKYIVPIYAEGMHTLGDKTPFAVGAIKFDEQGTVCDAFYGGANHQLYEVDQSTYEFWNNDEHRRGMLTSMWHQYPTEKELAQAFADWAIKNGNNSESDQHEIWSDCLGYHSRMIATLLAKIDHLPLRVLMSGGGYGNEKAIDDYIGGMRYANPDLNVSIGDVIAQDVPRASEKAWAQLKVFIHPSHYPFMEKYWCRYNALFDAYTLGITGILSLKARDLLIHKQFIP